MGILYYTVLILSAILVIDCYPALRRNLDKFDVEDNLSEYGAHFEGDMLLTRKQREAIYQPPEKRNGLRDVTKRWPNNTIVYHVNEEDFDDKQTQLIEEAIENIANKSCLKFRRREQRSEHAVLIQGSGSGCYSNVGFNDKENEEGEIEQVLNLSNGCFKIGTVIHEMLHTVGFYHMQSTYDRDSFVTIAWQNIIAGHEHNFKKYNQDIVTDFGVPYDYSSVMHYKSKAFSKNGEPTIIPLKENVEIGQRDGLSDSDILKINKMYCEQTETTEKPTSNHSHDKVINIIYE